MPEVGLVSGSEVAYLLGPVFSTVAVAEEDGARLSDVGGAGAGRFGRIPLHLRQSSQLGRLAAPNRDPQRYLPNWGSPALTGLELSRSYPLTPVAIERFVVNPSQERR